MNQQNKDPREQMAIWLPHAFILVILLSSLWLMSWVMKPLMSVLLMSAALAALTYPLTAGPMKIWIAKAFPSLKKRTLNQASAFGGIGMILLVFLIPIAIAIWTLTGSVSFSQDMFLGLLNKNLGQIDRLLDRLNEQLASIQELVPAFKIDPDWIKGLVKGFLGDILNLQPALMAFFFKGTGSMVVQILLAFIAITFFYAEGNSLSRAVLNYTPLNQNEIEKLMESFRNVILRLLVDTLGMAVSKGIVLGCLVGWFIGVPPIFLILLASFICLLPLVGTTLIWLPSATLLYQKGEWLLAILLVILCQVGLFAINFWMKRLGKKLHEHNATTSFFIFLSVIGGLVSFGIKGIVLGPMAIILVMVIGAYWRDYYHRNTGESKDHASSTNHGT
jgi:predicted PurR-regulated permease PerM